VDESIFALIEFDTIDLRVLLINGSLLEQAMSDHGGKKITNRIRNSVRHNIMMDDPHYEQGRTVCVIVIAWVWTQ
jgi:hypothetical protein